MSNLVHDLKCAVRLLVKQPLFSAIVIATLALGIGLNTAVFSAIDALILAPLPGVQAPDELVQVYRTWPGSMPYGSNSIPHFEDLRDRNKQVFAGVAAWNWMPMNISISGRPERVMGAVASANYFAVLGVAAERGRVFGPEEEVGRGSGAHPVAVLSHAGWKKLFGGDPSVIGKTLVLDGRSYSILGITPEGFKGSMPIATPVLWVPLSQFNHVNPSWGDRFEQRSNNSLSVVARLAGGVSLAVANQRMTALITELREIYPDDYRQSGINLVPQNEAGIHPALRGAQLGLTAVVMAVVVMLLLIACVNVANLFLARARDRSREMAVRLSIGARRGVLIRQLLTESLLLSGIAGLAGLLVALWAIRLANGVRLPFEIDFSPDLKVSPTVLIFTLGVSVVTGLLFGLAPALAATRPSLVPALKGEAPAGTGRSRMSRGLVVAQMALSIVLLVSAGLFLRNLQAATTVDKGFVSDNVLVADVDPGLQGYDRHRVEEFYRQLTQQLQALPEVRGVGYTSLLPLNLSNNDWSVTVPGYTPPPEENMSISVATVRPGYFEAMRIPLLQGRGFEERDDSSAAPGIVVNRRFVERFWAGQDPIGRVVRVGSRDHTVLGIVPTGKYFSLGEEPKAFMYLAQAQNWTSEMTIVIRTAADPAAVAPALRRIIQAADPDLPIANLKTMTNHLGLALLPARVAGTTLGIFGALGLLLASIGVYGVMSHTVSQRRREIGIRVAIGAAGSAVVRLLLREGMILVAIGTTIGLALAVVGSRLLRSVLLEGGFDPVTFALVPVILGAVALLAIWIPARRASAVNPVVVLRQE